jgi:hypothetical protein
MIMRAIAERWCLDSCYAQHFLLLRGYIMNKLIMVGFALLTLAACSEVEQEATVASTPVELQTASWDAVGEVFYNEFIPCTAGPDFSQESVDSMVAEWREGGLAPDLLGAWGYAPASDQNQFPNGWWEVTWPSKAAADAVWAQWAENDDAKAWSAKYESVMVCDIPSKYGWDFSFPRAPDSFGPSPESGNFASAFFACSFNEGKGADDLDATVSAYETWLDGLDAEAISFYAYGIYSARPETETNGVDFFWGHFHESMEAMRLGSEGWEASGGAAKASLEATATCVNPDIYNSKTFYDPTNPDFS